MNDLLEKVKTYRWWNILKALAFEGGPSSTKWVYLAMNAVLAVVVLGVATAICYRHIRFGGSDTGMSTVLITIVGIISGCATNALNYRRKLNAQVATGDKPLADATTPLTMAEPEGQNKAVIAGVIILIALLFSAGAQAQINVTANSCIATADMQLVAKGIFEVQITDGNDNPVFVSASGIQVTSEPVRRNVSFGSIPTFMLPTPSSAVPANYFARVTVTNSATNKTTVYRRVPVSPASGSWDWCHASLAQSFAGLPFVPVPGPAGPACSTGTGVCEMTVPVALPGDPTSPLQAATKQYLDNKKAYAAVTSPGTTYHAFGDSMTAGFYGDGVLTGDPQDPTVLASARSAPTNYVNRFAANFGWTATNHGVGGHWLNDQTDAIFGTTVTAGMKSSVMAGYNDAWQCPSTNANCLGMYQQELTAIMWQLALPDAQKIYANDSRIATTGTWLPGASGAYGGRLKYSTTPSSSMGTTVYGTSVVAVLNCDPTSGESGFRITVDAKVYPSPTGQYDASQCVASIGTGFTNYSSMGIRIGGLPSGKHAIGVTRVSGLVGVAFFAGNAGSVTSNAPEVFVGNVPRSTSASGLQGSGPTSWGSDARTSSYNATWRRLVNVAAQDGLNVVGVDASGAWNVDDPTLIYTDHIHPNGAGHGVIADAFIASANQLLTPSDRQSAAGLRDTGVARTQNGYLGVPMTGLMLGGTDDSVPGLPVFGAPGVGDAIAGVTASLYGVAANGDKWVEAHDSDGNVGYAGSISTSVADGTVPIKVVSTTPVPNLVVTKHPLVLTNSGANVTGGKIVIATGTLVSGAATVTLTGAAVFTGAVNCHAMDTTSGVSMIAFANSGSSIAVAGTGTHNFNLTCIGQ